MDPNRLCTSPFVGGTVILPVAVPPMFNGKGNEAAHQILSENLMRYHATLKGILVAFAKARFAATGTYNCSTDTLTTSSSSSSSLGRIVDELPVVFARLQAEVLLFRPRIGQILKGTVTNIGQGMIACLVGGLFNVIILQDDMDNGYSYDDNTLYNTITVPSSSSSSSSTYNGLDNTDTNPNLTTTLSSSSSASSTSYGMWVGTEKYYSQVYDARQWNEKEKSSSSASSVSSSTDKQRKRPRDDTGSSDKSKGSKINFNRILAANPDTIKVGDSIIFRVTAMSYNSNNVLSIHGSFVDLPNHELSPLLPERVPAPPVPIRRPSMLVSPNTHGNHPTLSRISGRDDSLTTLDRTTKSGFEEEKEETTKDGKVDGTEKGQHSEKKVKKEKKEKKEKKDK